MINFKRNFPLSLVSNYKIGGPADYLFEFKSKEELEEALSAWKELGFGASNIYVIGGGTNILFSDDGFRGLILKSDIQYIKHEGNVIEVGAGSKMADLVKYCIDNSLSGLEWAGGLPGTVGGAIRGNAGAFGGETKDSVESVESFNTDTHKIHKRENKDCNFSYRMSIFKKGEAEHEIILRAWFKVSSGNKVEIEEKSKEKEEYRENRHPLNQPNIGSTFKNVPIGEVSQNILEEFKDSIKNDPFPILPVAKLLSAAGLKEKTVGGAMVSPKHPNFIVNTGNATSSDVRNLIVKVKEEIKNKYGISLEEEIIYL
jgi:UDP-N-acetylmuramate dehydrogenase